MKFNPHDYQSFIIKRMTNSERLIAVVDMGLGKTVCALTAVNNLMFDLMVIKRVLVIAPLRVAENVWSGEIDKWDHLKHMKVAKILGNEQKRKDALNLNADVYLINRENVKWLVDHLKRWPFDMLIIDESSSFKNRQSQRFRALSRVSKNINRIIELTGTPSPNSLQDLWPQIYLLDSGERLGKSLSMFRNTFLEPDKYNFATNTVYSYKLKKGADKFIYDRIRDIAISLSAKDHLSMKDRIDNYILLDLPEKVKAQYDKLECESIIELDTAEEVHAGSKAVVINKLLQVANGAVYGENRKVSIIHDIKLDALEEIIENNSGRSILVFYNYIHDHDRIFERFKARTLKTTGDIEAWNRREVELMLAHPASAGHGLNLQAGGNIIVWFGVCWSLELYQQANARLYRQGQEQTVIVHHLLIRDTFDIDVMKALKAKCTSQDALIDAVKARVKGGNYDLRKDIP